MASSRLKLASERRKLALRALILNNRQKVATLQEQTKRARDELKQHRTGGNRHAVLAGLRQVKVS